MRRMSEIRPRSIESDYNLTAHRSIAAITWAISRFTWWGLDSLYEVIFNLITIVEFVGEGGHRHLSRLTRVLVSGIGIPVLQCDPVGDSKTGWIDQKKILMN